MTVRLCDRVVIVTRGSTARLAGDMGKESNATQLRHGS